MRAAPPTSSPQRLDLTKFIFSHPRWREPDFIVALAGLLTIVAPALLFGPWLPFVDLVSFVGMDAYPAQLSYGPAHYYTFQFTYIGHYAVSRFLTDLHVDVPHQILLLYLLQACTTFLVIWRSLVRLIPNGLWRAAGIGMGTLAFWDGMFLWGGPLAYSLAGSCLSIATFLMIREAAEPAKSASMPISLLVAFAMLCHPFAVPFALILFALRFVYVRPRRWQTAFLACAVGLYAIVIVRDSPASEATAAQTLRNLFGISGQQMKLRVFELFSVDRLFAQTLFGTAAAASNALFVALAAIHALGFVAAPYLIWRAREVIWLRIVATLTAIIGILYLFSWDLSTAPIPEWPQRIMTLYAPFTYLGGFCALYYLAKGLKRIRPPGRLLRGFWILPFAVLAYFWALQLPVLALGTSVRSNYEKIRGAILKANINSALLVVSDIDNIHPWYLRSVPFLLFSDPQLIRRHVLVSTEWHFQDRHPSRITENLVDLGRPRYVARFFMTGSTLDIELAEQPLGRFPIPERTNAARWGNVGALAQRQYREGTETFSEGFYTSAFEHFNTEIYLLPKEAQAWDDAGAALFKAGKPADAMPYFERAVALDPKMVQARINLAALLIEIGRPQEAVPQLKEALRLQPDSASAAGLLQNIEAASAAAARTKSGR